MTQIIIFKFVDELQNPIKNEKKILYWTTVVAPVA